MEDEDRESKRDRDWLRPRWGMQRYCVIKQDREGTHLQKKQKKTCHVSNHIPPLMPHWHTLFPHPTLTHRDKTEIQHQGVVFIFIFFVLFWQNNRINTYWITKLMFHVNMWSQSCFCLQHFHYCTLNCASPLAFFHAIVPLLTSSCHFTCPFHTVIPYITLFLVLSTLPILFRLPFSSDPSSHLTLFFSLPWPTFILFSNCTLSPLFSDSNYMATAITTFLPSPFSLSSFLCPLPFILPTPSLLSPSFLPFSLLNPLLFPISSCPLISLPLLL